MVRILLEDTIFETARKIYEEFDVNQSCTIVGFITTPAPDGGERLELRGDLVWKEIKQMDGLDNMCETGATRRKARRFGGDCIGGFVMQKTFRRKKEAGETDVRYTIWRIQ